ncbi:MAG: 50S ribosomal protein L29 [Candidatus Cloacimonadota bacterium]|nr:MAG: 50S ribosomal protein L29 [Candidatus Cloacimonadota bacterium]
MKMSELRELSNEEINIKLEELREEAFNLRFNKAMNRLENPGRIKVVKKDIARIHTLITERNAKR